MDVILVDGRWATKGKKDDRVRAWNSKYPPEYEHVGRVRAVARVPAVTPVRRV